MVKTEWQSLSDRSAPATRISSCEECVKAAERQSPTIPSLLWLRPHILPPFRGLSGARLDGQPDNHHENTKGDGKILQRHMF